MKKTHFLRITPNYFDDVYNGKKRCEVSKKIRNFEEGDLFDMYEYDPLNDSFSGRMISGTITHVLDNQAYCKASFVIFSFIILSKGVTVRDDEELKEMTKLREGFLYGIIY